MPVLEKFYDIAVLFYDCSRTDTTRAVSVDVEAVTYRYRFAFSDFSTYHGGHVSLRHVFVDLCDCGLWYIQDFYDS